MRTGEAKVWLLVPTSLLGFIFCSQDAERTIVITDAGSLSMRLESVTKPRVCANKHVGYRYVRTSDKMQIKRCANWTMAEDAAISPAALFPTIRFPKRKIVFKQPSDCWREGNWAALSANSSDDVHVHIKFLNCFDDSTLSESLVFASNFNLQVQSQQPSPRVCESY